MPFGGPFINFEINKTLWKCTEPPPSPFHYLEQLVLCGGGVLSGSLGWLASAAPSAPFPLWGGFNDCMTAINCIFETSFERPRREGGSLEFRKQLGCLLAPQMPAVCGLGGQTQGLGTQPRSPVFMTGTSSVPGCFLGCMVADSWGAKPELTRTHPLIQAGLPSRHPEHPAQHCSYHCKF